MRLALDPIICCVTDRRSLPIPSERSSVTTPEAEFDDRARFAGLARFTSSLIHSGVDWIQIREKDAPAALLRNLASRATSIVRHNHARTRIIINDRLDVAFAAAAHGVHFGEASVPLTALLPWLRQRQQNEQAPQDFFVGVSCHSLESALEAGRDGVSYVFFGPVFSTPSKASFGAPQGLLRLAEVCRRVDIPVLAIGGVTLENASACMDAGARGIAAIRMFQRAANVGETIAALRKSLESRARGKGRTD